ncbi:MAG: FtsW/RodA/SpoVE family cell cycle protein, partial [Anaerolineae bacterium]|nr:FtsW/RodA/SpoVE family cell cycle protein [Anaerolineae bacterium]
VMVGLAPFAGNALPLVSAGGSSMVVSMLAIGIILNVSRLGYQAEQEAATSRRPVLDFRNRKTAYYAKTVAPPARVEPAVQPRKRPNAGMATRPKVFRIGQKSRRSGEGSRGD